ncbi:uncharacterized protein QC761_0024570 [Podospora bellae-mahoneyi]|uniref:AAA+ ATPase lid domain-containing protein n=1 Tax=Podospora bellae-mahoneyi TaxID=2093777 RepID=A0ABR0FSN9_9PEZI|nr:hypothetical protein QC761_0024570 [Podospora bellae-mahoneyi]
MRRITAQIPQRARIANSYRRHHHLKTVDSPPMDPFMRGLHESYKTRADSAVIHSIMAWGGTGDCNLLLTLDRTWLCVALQRRRPHPPPGFPYTSYDLLDPTAWDLNLGPWRSRSQPQILALRLRSRLLTWPLLRAEYQPGAIDTLVMPAPRKQMMIKAWFREFTDPKDSLATSGADFIENKGRSDIPTSWWPRQCIAEYANRPLLAHLWRYRHQQEIRMEQQLSKWFRLAENGGCRMLIDEDRRLSRRRVVIFLRCIEYYRGILFLTTNRVGHFDDAFVSRIHVVIKYDPLSEDNRHQIWTQFFDKLTDERQDFIITGRAKQYVLEDDIIKKLEWNGREIRNAFQTAVAWRNSVSYREGDKSKHEGQPWTRKTLSRQFKEYLHDLHGLDEEGRAYNARARAGNQDWVRSTAK